MRQRVTGLLCVVSAFVVLESCGSKGPTAPTATSITVNSSSGFLVLGQTETFTATLAFSDGTSQTLTGGAWGSDAPTVATVGATTGLVTSARSGEVTIFVDAQGIRGSKRITVAPNYQGIWSGTYLVTSCTETGGFVAGGLCAAVFTNGASLPVAFNLTQTGGNLIGQTALGGVVSSQFLTTVVSGGGLVFQATAQLPIQATPPVNFRIDQAWQMNMAVAGVLTGTVVQTWTEPTTSGNMLVGATLETMTKSSAEPMAVRPETLFQSVADALRRRH